MRKVPAKPSVKPIKVKLAKPFNCAENMTRVCLIVKDPEADFKSTLDKLDVPCIADVIGYDRLKREFKQYKDRRALLADFDLFLADIRIYNMLPAVLGKEFYSRKKFPAPLKLHGIDDKEMQKVLNEASECTFFMPGNGPNYSVQVGTSKMSEKDVAKNCSAALS